MPSKKNQRMSLNLTDKNRQYLQRLRLMDQHGRSKTKENQLRKVSLNSFVNECITIVCESGMHSRRHIADDEELNKAFSIFMIKKLTKELQPVRELYQFYREQVTDEDLLKAV